MECGLHIYFRGVQQVHSNHVNKLANALPQYISVIMIFIIVDASEATLQAQQGRLSAPTGISMSNSENVMEGTHRSRNWRKYLSTTLGRLTAKLIQYGRD